MGEGRYPIEVECSSGTYIRSLAADVGTALGGGAHLRDLRRTAIGSFTVDQAKPLEALTPEALLTPAEALRDLAAVTVDEAMAADVAHGKVLDRDRLGVSGRRPVGGARRRTARSSRCTRPTAARPAKPSVVLAQPDGSLVTSADAGAARGRELPATRRRAPSSPSAPTTACTSATRR